jgi:hypothetical protein
MRRMRAAVVGLGLALLAGRAVAGGSSEAVPAGEGYKATAAWVAPTPAAPGRVEVVVAIDPAYHWNVEYPAKVEVLGEVPAGLDVPQRIVKAAGGGFAVTPQRVTATVPVAVKGARGGEVALVAKFSICSARVCLMKTAKLSAWAGPR